jgi:hypothetical protein
MGQQSSKGEKGDKGDNATINYPTLTAGLLADSTFADSIKNTIIDNARLFKGNDGRGIQSLRITGGNLISKMTDGNEITASGFVGPAGRDGRGIERVDFDTQNGSMTVVLQGDEQPKTFTSTTNYNENFIKGKTLWCTDGQVCQIPKGNAYINLPVMNTAGSDAQSQVLRVGNWEIGQNSAGSLQFTSMISVPGPIAGTFLPTMGNVFTMNTAGELRANSMQTNSVSATGDIFSNRLYARGEVVSSNGFTLYKDGSWNGNSWRIHNSDDDNLNIVRWGDADTILWLHKTGKLYFKNGWEINPIDHDQAFEIYKNGKAKLKVDKDGNLFAWGYSGNVARV